MTPSPSPASGGFSWRALLRVLAIVAYPFAELAVFLWVGNLIGVWWSLAVILGTAVLGGWLVGLESRASAAAYRQLREAGRSPEGEILDVLLIMLGGILLFLPGYIGDVVGLLAILPFTRPLLRSGASALVDRWLRRRGVDVTRLRMVTNASTVIEGETVADAAGGAASTEERGPDTPRTPGDDPDDPLVIRGEIEP
ncbi:FxsA family protein [Propionicicella superfundia]|uniref:FxsA family protein n=1 Tax=Propionicicella superfundia TaxID=348582 RepID=UPI000686008A|nr:FxsA family protein [Propionicicella superfundia]